MRRAAGAALVAALGAAACGGPPPDPPAPGPTPSVASSRAATLADAALPADPATATDPADAPAPARPAALDGFRVDAWFLPDEAQLGFVEVPAGPFLMGSDPAVDRLAFANERWSNRRPQGRVELPAFAIGRTEVTVAQFAAFAAATGAVVAPEALRGRPDHPVASVSWPDALRYCRWLESTLAAWPGTPAQLRRRLAAGWKLTLPTEAQWEKAARGPDGRIWPWGDRPRRDRARFAGAADEAAAGPARAASGGGPRESAAGPAPVGSFPCPECPYGLHDMAGNVWEWTASLYRLRPGDAPAAALEADALFVMRGGSWLDPAASVRAAVRGGADPGARRPFIGFRVALTPPD